jgi:nucleoside-diphosphate-sugar epimerase
MKHKSVMVTGASGFIGGHIARRLAEEGCTVFALYRRKIPPVHLEELEERGGVLVQADLSDGPALRENKDFTAALAGSDGIVHAAAKTGDWGREKEFVRSNFDPTRRLFEAARAAGSRSFVYISSVAVHGFGNHRDTAEDGPYYPYINPYQLTKKRAEEFVLEQNTEEMKTTAVRPGNAYGPGDTTTMFPIFDAMERGLMGYLGSGETLTCPVYIDDLADAVIRALESEKSGGEAFNIVSDEKVTWKDLLETSAQLLGIPAPKVHLSPFVSKCAAGILSAVFHAFFIRHAPPITFYRVHQLINNYDFSNEKAKRLLGYSPKTGLRTGLQRTVEDYLKRRSPA